MREIKFRAWDKHNKKMIDGPMAMTSDWVLFTAEVENESCHNAIHPIQQYEIMQYTGLKDCKGKGIYESDILRGYHAIPSEGPIFQVYWDRGGFIVRSSEDGMRYDIGDIEHKKVEIIGNIYEHPELLREEDGSQ